jgi:hypothetical protein
MEKSLKFGYIGIAAGLASAILIGRSLKVGTIGYIGLGIALPVVGAVIGNNLANKDKGKQPEQVAQTKFQSLDIKNIDKA